MPCSSRECLPRLIHPVCVSSRRVVHSSSRRPCRHYPPPISTHLSLDRTVSFAPPASHSIRILRSVFHLPDGLIGARANIVPLCLTSYCRCTVSCSRHVMLCRRRVVRVVSRWCALHHVVSCSLLPMRVSSCGVPCRAALHHVSCARSMPASHAVSLPKSPFPSSFLTLPSHGFSPFGHRPILSCIHHLPSSFVTCILDCLTLSLLVVTAGIRPLTDLCQLPTQIFDNATLKFLRKMPQLAKVIPVMDKIDEKLTDASRDINIHCVVRIAANQAKSTMNKYYGLTDAADAYRIAIRESFLIAGPSRC